MAGEPDDRGEYRLTVVFAVVVCRHTGDAGASPMAAAVGCWSMMIVV